MTNDRAEADNSLGLRLVLKENRMATTVAQMTKEELREMIETAIEQKLLEMFGDPNDRPTPTTPRST
jgi:hypothetical protein